MTNHLSSMLNPTQPSQGDARNDTERPYPASVIFPEASQPVSPSGSPAASPLLTWSSSPHPSLPQLQQQKDRTAKASKLGDAQNYDRETVLILLGTLKEAGYGVRKEQRKSLKDMFAESIRLAGTNHGVKRTAKGWQKKVTRMKQEYSTYIDKISKSGQGGDDDDLYKQPEFFKEMHEIEHNKARHDPPAVLASHCKLDKQPRLSSSGKRVKLSQSSFIESYIEQQQLRGEALLHELKLSNEEKAKMRSIMERLIEKL